jgi:long-chain fatty acid transport protein
VLAAGVYAPFGLRLDWPEDGEQRYSVVAADLKTIYITPTVAWRVTDRLSVGAGLSIVRADAELTKKAPGNPPSTDPLFDIDVAVEGNAIRFGADAGVQYRLRDDLTWGFSWISPVEIELEGDVTATIPPALVEAFGGVSEFTDRGRVALRMPHQVRMGILWEGIDGIGLEFDVSWLDWSTHETITFDYDNTTPLTAEDGVLRRDWTDALSFHAGAEWDVRPDLVLRGGYVFDQTAVPDETLDPILPQADKSIYTIGTGYRRGRIALDLAFAWLVDEPRTTTKSVHGFPTNGRYESSVGLLSFGAGVWF